MAGLFIGTHHNRLDAKGRVSVPAPFRQALETNGDGTVTCFPATQNTCLEAMSTDVISSLLAAANKNYATFSQENDALLTAIVGRARSPEMGRRRTNTTTRNPTKSRRTTRRRNRLFRLGIALPNLAPQQARKTPAARQ